MDEIYFYQTIKISKEDKWTTNENKNEVTIESTTPMYLHMTKCAGLPNWKRPNSFGIKLMREALNVWLLHPSTCKTQYSLKTWRLDFLCKKCCLIALPQKEKTNFI
jgi:hypothetical protein